VIVELQILDTKNENCLIFYYDNVLTNLLPAGSRTSLRCSMSRMRRRW